MHPYPLRATPAPERRPQTLLERYCELQNIPEQKFEAHLLAKALPPAVRPFWTIIRLMAPGYFAADLDLIRNTARLRRLRDFNLEAREFHHHPANRGFWRRGIGVRVSVQRMRRIVRHHLHGHGPH